MIEHITVHIEDYYDDDQQDILSPKLIQFKKNMFYFCIKIHTNGKYKQIRSLWNISVDELRSESIVESICSVLKKICTPDRSRLKYLTMETSLQLRLSLPLSKKEGDIVIKKVIQRYHEEYPSMITHTITKAQRKKREEKGISTSTTIDKWEKGINTAFTVPFD